MGVAGDVLLTLIGVALVLVAPLAAAFWALVTFWLLVPGLLIVPHAPHLLLVNRAVLYAFALRLLFRRNQGEPSVSAYAPTPVHIALGLLLIISFADGVVFAPSSVSLASDLDQWLSVLDLMVLFVVVLAVIRTISIRRALNPIVFAVTVAAVLGLWERAFGQGWSHFFFEGLPAGYLAPGSGALSTRGTSVRSQVAGQFALEYGWVLAILLPLAIVVTLRWARARWKWARLALFLPIVVLVAAVFSGSRSAELAAGAAIVLVAMVAGANRLLISFSIGATLVGILVLVVNPSFLTSSFSSAGDPASIRLDRLPTLFALVVHRPFIGLGLNGVSSVFGGIDNGYALIYATLGVLGVLAWLTVIVTALAGTTRALRARRGSDIRMLGAASIVGIVGVAVAASSYDLSGTPQSAWALVFLAALGASVAEAVPIAPRTTLRTRWRLLMPLGGLAIGLVVLVATPVSASQSLSVFTVAPWVSATQGVGAGTELVDTFCGSNTNPDVVLPQTSVKCVNATDIRSTDYPGLAIVTVSAPTPEAVRRQVARFTPIGFYFHKNLVIAPSGPIATGKPAWATTAPLSGAWAGLFAAILVPPLSPRRRRPLHSRQVTRDFAGNIGFAALDTGSRVTP